MAELKDRRGKLEALYASLKDERTSGFDEHWKELSNYFLPRRTRWWSGDRNKGDKRNQHIINSTGRFAARTLQSGMHAGLTSPARPWMRLTLPGVALRASAGVREWLDAVSRDMLTMFSVSNLYNCLPTVYGDMGVFGTGAMAILEDGEDTFRAYTFPLGSYVLGHNSRGVLDQFGREYEMTVLQVVSEFAARPNRDIDRSVLSNQVKTAYDRGDYNQPVEVRWMIAPNENADPRRLGAQWLPFTSAWWDTGTSEPAFLRFSGFQTFPVMAPRWDVTGEDNYGSDCPGMSTLGDNKQLQAMERQKGKAIAKMVDPPLQAPTSLRTQKTSILPGDITYADVREGMAGIRAIHEIGLNLEHLGRDLQAVEYRIKRAFFEDLFLMLATVDPYRGSAPPTAREIDERHEEKLLALGPVLERTADELLDPLVDRVFDIMQRAGMIPPPPPELQGRELKPEYISILSQAQKLVGVVAQDRLLQTVIPAIQTFPAMAAKVNTDQLVDNYAEMLGVDPRAIRSTDEANAIVQRQQQMEADQAAAQQAATMAKALKDGSQTKLDQDSALDRLVTAAGSPRI